MSGAAAVFIDKDGTLVRDVPYNVDPARLVLTPHAAAGLRRLRRLGFRLFVVSNQPGIALGRFDRAALARLAAALAGRLRCAGVRLDGFYACPHPPVELDLAGCACRKPAPGLLHAAARAHGLALADCWMIGDILNDIEAGRRAGCRTVLLDVGNETVWQRGPLREPHLVARDLLDAARQIEAASPAAPPGADGRGGAARFHFQTGA